MCLNENKAKQNNNQPSKQQPQPKMKTHKKKETQTKQKKYGNYSVHMSYRNNFSECLNLLSITWDTCQDCLLRSNFSFWCNCTKVGAWIDFYGFLPRIDLTSLQIHVESYVLFTVILISNSSTQLRLLGMKIISDS